MNGIGIFKASRVSLRVPLLVALLMIVISVAISDRVLSRLSEMQESNLQGLVDSYLDGLSASILPSMMRGDIWEVFDVLDRSASRYASLDLKETIATGADGNVIASNHPKNRPSFSKLAPDFLSGFGSANVVVNRDTMEGFARRDLVYQGQRVGTIYTILDVSHLLAERRNVLVTLLITNGVLACLFAAGGFWLVSFMIRPMKILENHMRNSSGGLINLIDSKEIVILNWPDGFHEIAEEVRASAPSRSGYYSVRKDLGPLVALTRDPHLPDPMRLLIRSMIKENAKGISGIPVTLRAEYRPPSDFIPLRKATKRFATHNRVILRYVERGDVGSLRAKDAKRSPILVNSRDLEAIVELSRSSIEARSVAVQLGIPRQYLNDLVAKGYIVPAARPDADPGAEFYSKRSVEDLKRRCRSMVRDESPPLGAVRISRAVSQLRLGPRASWGGIVDRILKREIEIWAANEKLSIAAYVVRNRFCLSGLPLTDPDIKDDVIFSQGEAAAFLGTTVTRVNQLARAGLISAGPTIGELRSFSQEYSLTPEVMEMLELKGITVRRREVRPRLQSHGIEPHAAVNGACGYVWRRAEICSFGNTATTCETG